MKNRKGFSLAVAFGLLIMIFLLCMASFSVLLSGTAVSRSVYGKNVTSNVAETGFNRGAISILEDAENNFQTILSDQGGVVIGAGVGAGIGTVNYSPLLENVTYVVNLRDNDDLDGDINVDTDLRVIVTAVGEIQGASETSIEVYVAYEGKDNEYDQDTRTATSTSNYGQSEAGALSYKATN